MLIDIIGCSIVIVGVILMIMSSLAILDESGELDDVVSEGYLDDYENN